MNTDEEYYCVICKTKHSMRDTLTREVLSVDNIQETIIPTFMCFVYQKCVSPKERKQNDKI